MLCSEIGYFSKNAGAESTTTLQGSRRRK